MVDGAQGKITKPGLDHRNIKPEDTRPQKLGWAPGGYICRCFRCECTFTGDKRAVNCADCAYSAEES